MARALPTPTADTIRDLRAVGRYLDYVSDIAITDQGHAIARRYASAVYRAIGHLEQLGDTMADLSAAEIERGDLARRH